VLDVYIGEIKAKPNQKPDLAAAYYLLAKVYFAVGDDAKCDEALLNVFSARLGFDQDESNYGFKEWLSEAKAQLAGNLPAKVDTKTVKQKPKVEPQAVEIAKKNAVTVVKKKKKFPLLLAIVGVGVVAVLILLLGKKKNNTPVTPTGPYTNGVLTINGVRYELAAIQAGEFQMGSNSSEADSDEQPVHTVRISKGFWMGKTEVTQGLWQAVMGSNPSYFKNGDSYPVEKISWDDCQAFITKLNQMVGGNAFRLPTEAEWEYACRAGTTGDRYGDIDAIAWYSGNSGNTTHIVGQKQANAWGLYDTLGNVYEWCQDWYGAYSAGYQTDPTGPGSGAYRVLRGACWNYSAQYVRSAIRGSFFHPGFSNFDIGVRLASNSANGG
jgi:formylglycine-generating enzyme required for sulfatase activity